MNFKDYDKKSNEKKMIFILGMPRSGTTLVEKIISSHSKVSTISEANYIPEKIFNHLNDDVENFQSFIDSCII